MNTDVPSGAARWSRRRTWSLLAALVVVVAVASAFLALGDRRAPGDVTSPVAGSTAATTAGPAPGATDPASGATDPSAPSSDTAAPAGGPPASAADPVTIAQELPPDLPAVALEEPVPVDGLTIEVASIEGIDGQATGPGNIAGPAVRVTVRVTNDSSADVSLDAVVVNLFHGPEATPASPLEDPSQEPFSGALRPGASADGVYVFTLATGDRDSVTVQVGHAPGASYAVFTGAAS
ncbi:hypothetical protein O2W15_03445 [Modestobacter sp. VKM Ac-2979]|uniref:hypothetical protein n=1 Tax=unclassified Modestobacter TaxID=2643866 RepID=UPI0022ABB3D7|nr:MULTISPECIES: hypothetical protein [unclassified Modestobacter]MCZ2810483.1 hypothetical protein [Modestobacter sp. VKM Ac-2979]MCZ2841969.1 hypothetical protein [Modestobacter sp. VKM Ac-2980]